MEPPGEKRYEDLRIELELAPDVSPSSESISGSLSALLRGQTAGIQQPFRLRVSRSDIDEALSTVSFASRQISTRGAKAVQKGVLDPIKYLGANLFAALFEGPLGSLYQEKVRSSGADAPPLRLRIAMAGRMLDELPWEFLYDSVRNDFPALSMRSPIVREPRGQAGARTALATIQPPLRVLVAAARVAEGIDSEREIAMLRRITEGAPVQLEIVPEATLESLFEAIRTTSPHIFHFIGTGAYRGTGDGISPPPQELALLESVGARSAVSVSWQSVSWQALGPIALGTELSNLDELHLVFLNACNTDLFAARLAEWVPAVVGMRGNVSDEMCNSFAEGFYRAVIEGHPLDGAVTAGRQNIDRANPGGREWGMPVLYMPAAEGTLFGGALPQPAVAAAAPAAAIPLTSQDPAVQRQYQNLRRQLELHRSNIQALEERSKAYASSPEFIEKQFASQLSPLRNKVAELEAQLSKLHG